MAARLNRVNDVARLPGLLATTVSTTPAENIATNLDEVRARTIFPPLVEPTEAVVDEPRRRRERAPASEKATPAGKTRRITGQTHHFFDSLKAFSWVSPCGGAHASIERMEDDEFAKLVTVLKEPKTEAEETLARQHLPLIACHLHTCDLWLWRKVPGWEQRASERATARSSEVPAATTEDLHTPYHLRVRPTDPRQLEEGSTCIANPVFGGELSITSILWLGHLEAVNSYVTAVHPKRMQARWGMAPSVRKGTSDMAAHSSTVSSSPAARGRVAVLVGNKRVLSDRDNLVLVQEVQHGSVRISYANGRLQTKKSWSSELKCVLAQVFEQFHANKCDNVLLGNYDTWILLHMTESTKVRVSKPFFRVPQLAALAGHASSVQPMATADKPESAKPSVPLLLLFSVLASLLLVQGRTDKSLWRSDLVADAKEEADQPAKRKEGASV